VTKGLSDFYKARGNFEKALNYLSQKQEYDLKIFDEATMRQTKRLERQFENKQLQAEIRGSRDREKQRQIQIIMLVSVCLLLLVILLLLRISSNNKHKLERERNLRLQEQKEEGERRAQLTHHLQLQEQARLKS